MVESKVNVTWDVLDPREIVNKCGSEHNDFCDRYFETYLIRQGTSWLTLPVLLQLVVVFLWVMFNFR